MLQPFRCLYRHRSLLVDLARRNVAQRYRDSLFGGAWSVIQPILMLAIYTFVFSVVYQVRWNTGPVENQASFALALFLGLVLHGFLAEVLGGAPFAVTHQPNLVKKVVFPVEVLPAVTVAVACFTAAMNLGVFFAFLALSGGPLHPQILALPLIMLPLVVFAIGLAWGLAGLGVFLRDVAHLAPIAATVLLFLSPVLYPLSRVPERFHVVIFLSPLTQVIEAARAAVFLGVAPSGAELAVALGISVLFAWAGFRFFEAVRPEFADVL